MKASLAEGETKYQTTHALSVTVCEYTSPAGCERIEQDMDLLKAEYDQLTTMVASVETALSNSLTGAGRQSMLKGTLVKTF